jgi:hypothetical protein
MKVGAQFAERAIRGRKRDAVIMLLMMILSAVITVGGLANH